MQPHVAYLLLLIAGTTSSPVPSPPAVAAQRSPLPSPVVSVVTPQLNDLADSVFAWRALTQPISADDLPRCAVDPRPAGWAPNVTAAALKQRELDYEAFVRELEALRRAGGGFEAWDRDDQADWWALSSVLARAFWELRIQRAPWVDPGFYLAQSAGAIWGALVQQPKPGSGCAWSAARLRDQLIPRVEAVAVVLAAAETNLATPIAAFVTLTLGTLDGLAPQLTASMDAVVASASACSSPVVDPALLAALRAATVAACAALARYAGYLAALPLAAQSANASEGSGAFAWQLEHVSFVTAAPSTIAALGQRELSLASAMRAVEHAANGSPAHAAASPPMPLAPTLAAQIDATAASYRTVRSFVNASGFATIPAWVQNYTIAPLPAWLTPFPYSALGEEDDFTDPMRSAAGQSFVRYIPPPVEGLPFFLDGMARDAKPVIVHEGLPGHWFQFSMSWRNLRHARRHWLSSVANEGWAYYAEEALLHAGLFDAPSRRLRETMWELMRLRGLRVVVDAGLGGGTIDEAAAIALLASEVPMSVVEARAEVALRLQDPGQGLSYVLGKHQLMAMLRRAVAAAAKKERGAAATAAAAVAATKGAASPPTFDLRRFHDDRLANGNLPFALQYHACCAGDEQEADADPLLPRLSPSLRNLHHAFPSSVDAKHLAALAAHPDRIAHLPGQPADSNVPLSFSGNIDVSATAEVSRSLFYYLVHADGGESSAVAPPPPLIIWLQGGNGCSSLLGAFSENGPFNVVRGSTSNNSTTTFLGMNNFSWHLLPAHVVFLDRPAGTGFSYFTPQSANASAWANDRVTALDTANFVKQLLQKHPWLCNREIFIAGESYAGHFTIQAALALLNDEEAAGGGLCADVAGVLIGNGVVSINETNFAWFENGYTHSLVSEEAWTSVRTNCDFTKDLGIDGNGCPSDQTAACREGITRWFNESAAASGELSLYDYYADVCLADVTPAMSAVTALSPDPCSDDAVTEYFQRSDVRLALHVSPLAPAFVPCSAAINDAYSCSDTLVSVVKDYEALLAHAGAKQSQRLLVYSGDVDGIVPTQATRRWIAELISRRNATDPTTTSDSSSKGGGDWGAWFEGAGRGQLAGYTQRWEWENNASLVFATVRNAGHQVPAFQPKRAFAMARRFIYNGTLQI